MGAVIVCWRAEPEPLSQDIMEPFALNVGR